MIFNPLILKMYKGIIKEKINNFEISDLMVSIESSNICNAKCVMCPYQKMTRKKETMPMTLFKKIVDNCLAHGIKSFSLSFYNEPFLDLFIFERIGYLKSKGVRVQLFSNGSVMDNKKIEKILKIGLDAVIFSVDGIKKETYESIRQGLVFEKTVSNILNLIKRKRDLGLEKPKIKLNFIKQELNKAELREFQSFWSDKVDKIYISSDDNRNKAPELFRGEESPFASVPCLRLWGEILVMSNGKIPLCCCDYDGEIILGDFNAQDLRDIWYSDTFKKIRQLHLNFEADKIPLCKKCVTPYRTNPRILRISRK